MIEQIFDNIKGTRARAEINSMLKRLYGSSMTVEDALHNHNVKLPDAGSRENLAYLVLGVRDGARTPEYLELDEAKTLRLWSVEGPSSWTCVRIRTQEEWDRAVGYFCKNWSVDTDWGTFRDGMSAFGGEDVYMFRRYIDRFVIDSPDSNYDGCESSHTFLTVTCREHERKRYMDYLQAIDDGEAGAWTRYLD